MTLARFKKNQTLLKKILQTAEDKKVTLYLVGGILRDILLNREKENPDFDFCLKRGAINFGRYLARVLKSGFVVLDKAHGSCRLVLKRKNQVYTLDFTDFRGRTLEDDLLHRDFSINSMALELRDVFSREKIDRLIIDPYGGMPDLKKGLIRAINKEVFQEDPLRILRTFSLASIFNFKIHRNTLRLIRQEKVGILSVSGERLREEIFKLISTAKAYEFIKQLDKLRLLDLVVPQIKKMRKIKQGPYHHLDVWGHSLETLRHIELIMQSFARNKEMCDYLNTEISSGHKRYALVKLAALLHDVGKPKTLRIKKGRITFHSHERVGVFMTGEIAARLKFSNDEVRALKQMILFHLRPGYLADNPQITFRAIFRYFRDTAEEAVSTLLISLADQRATKGPLTSRQVRMRHEKVVADLIQEYFRRKKEKKPVRLITGDDLLKEFALNPSPLLGKILSKVEELQAIGRLKTKEEALKVAARFIK